MKIFSSVNPGEPEPFVEYFEYNKIAFSRIDLFSDDIDIHGRYDIPDSIMGENQLLVMSDATFRELLTDDQSRNNSQIFCNSKNHIWVYGTYEVYGHLLAHLEQLQQLDQAVCHGTITVFLDVVPTQSSPLRDLKNIQIVPWVYNWHFFMPRIQNGVVEKKNCQKDYLVTTVLHNYRPHRRLLYKEMQSRTNLLEKGHAYFNEPGQPMVGELEQFQKWIYGTPSMDLYLDSWLEVVPETLYENAFFFTEKTCKSIATKTPFLLLSTPGYLEYLRTMGFKTFSKLIDESYNEQYNINDQVSMLVDTLEHIIKQGSQEFYEASKEILDHNHSRLSELGGSRTYFHDLFVCQQLEKIF